LPKKTDVRTSEYLVTLFYECDMNMKNNNEQTFVQVWDYLLDNEELDVSDVLLMSKVISLHETKDGCYMTNEYISKMLRLKNIETASRRINKLQKLGYVELRFIPSPNNPKNTRRFIVPTYQKGLSQKSIPLDLKVNDPLISKSTPIDFKVNPPLTSKSTTPCLESQSIRSVNNIIENISLVHQSNNISSTILTEFEKEQLLLVMNNVNAPERVLSLVKTLITDGPGYLTKSNRELVVQHKNYFKGKVFEKVLQQLF
jgi:hypothetical protein